MIVVNNDDRPGVIGTVGTLLGDAGVNIADMDVSKAAERRHRRDADRPDAPGVEPARDRGPASGASASSTSSPWRAREPAARSASARRRLHKVVPRGTGGMNAHRGPPRLLVAAVAALTALPAVATSLPLNAYRRSRAMPAASTRRMAACSVTTCTTCRGGATGGGDARSTGAQRDGVSW